MLYPLKFKPILKYRIWGGGALVKAGKKAGKSIPADKVGESWELSGVPGDISVCSNGFLKSNNLQELIEVYMSELVGEKVYETYGLEFPVLIKLIDARDVLSIQVHPDDELAEEKHGGRGKTEMWYIVDCEPGAYLYVGFNREVSPAEYSVAVKEGRIAELLKRYEVKKGDTFYIPAGTIHALGPGMLVAEIQQTSDITYRVDDWGRVDADGNPRELHRAEALDAIKFESMESYYRRPAAESNKPVELVSTPYFTTNLIELNGKLTREAYSLDSFVAYMCLEGTVEFTTEGGTESIKALETILIPAEADDITLSGEGALLEVFIA